MGSAGLVRKLHAAELGAVIADGEGRPTKKYKSKKPSKATIEDVAEDAAVPSDPP